MRRAYYRIHYRTSEMDWHVEMKFAPRRDAVRELGTSAGDPLAPDGSVVGSG